MESKLQQSFNLAEKHRNELIQQLQGYSEEVLNRLPAPEKWSPIQVMHHLILSETNTINYLRKKMMGMASARKSGFSAKVRIWLTKLWLATSFLKRKAPPAIANVPDSATLADTVALWNTTRNQLKGILDELPQGAAERELFRHPVAGMFNLYQMIEFLDAHFRHHEVQIQKALRP